MQMSKNPKDPADTFENRRSWKSHWAMVNVESVSKKIKMSAFFDKTDREKLPGKNYQNMPLNWIVFHPLVLTYKDCQADSIVYRLPSKKTREETFIADNSPKKKHFGGRKFGKWEINNPL